MKLVYEPTRTYYRVHCQQTCEEKMCETEEGCRAWAKKVVQTFQHTLSFVVTVVTESSAEIEQVYGS